MEGPAYKIITKRLLLSCYEPNDAYLLKETIDMSLEHLKRWLTWAHAEPQDIEQKIQLIRKTRSNFDLDKHYVYGIFLPDRSKLIGVIALMRRIDEDALEMGYWLGSSYVKQGYMLEAAKAVIKVAFLLDIIKIEVHCDSMNLDSQKLAEKLGFTHEATLRRNEMDEKNNRKETTLYVLFKEDYEKTNTVDLDIKAYDFINQPVI